MVKGVRYYLQVNRAKKLIRASGISDRDIFLASFPKSGNTWLRFILANALYPESELSLANITAKFPTMHKSTAEEIKKLASPRFIKTHDAFFSLYGKTIYLVRDYRDVAVSAYFHAKSKSNYSGNISSFISGNMLNAFGPWHWHVSEAMKKKESDESNFLLIRYEDLRNSPVEHIKVILNFCGITSTLDASEINERASFGKLKSKEQSENTDKDFFRSGISGDWKNHLRENDLKVLLDDRTKFMMTKLGYGI